MKVTVRVKPGSRKGPSIQPGFDGELLVYVREPAVDGRANKAVIGLLAKYYDKPKSNIKIIRGRTAKTKIIEVE